MARLDNEIGRPERYARLAVGDPGQGAHRDTGTLGEGTERPISGHDVRKELHGDECFPKRKSSQPQMEPSTVIPIFGYPSGMRNGPPSVSEAILAALKAVAKDRGAAAIVKETGIAPSNLSRWLVEGRFGLNTRNLDALMRVPEIRAAAVSALLRRAETDRGAWEGISGEIAEVLSPAAGWRLARLLRRMKEADSLDPEFAVLEAVLVGEENAKEQSERRKVADLKRKRKT